jgi:hypothetical protein
MRIFFEAYFLNCGFVHHLADGMVGSLVFKNSSKTLLKSLLNCVVHSAQIVLIIEHIEKYYVLAHTWNECKTFFFN